jgi:hypothetical protein
MSLTTNEEFAVLCLVSLIGIPVLIFGFYALVSGHLPLFPGRVVRGSRARVLGIVGVLPLPCSLIPGFFLAVILTAPDDTFGAHSFTRIVWVVLPFVTAWAVLLAVALMYGVGCTIAAPGELGVEQHLPDASETGVRVVRPARRSRATVWWGMALALALLLIVGSMAGLGMHVANTTIAHHTAAVAAVAAVHKKWIDAGKAPEPLATKPFPIDPILAQTNPGRTVFLSDLMEFATRPEKGKGHYPFSKDGLPKGPKTPVKVKDMAYHKALYMHPVNGEFARTCYALGKKAKSLQGKVALNDTLLKGKECAVSFMILGDDKVLWKSEPFTKTGILQEFSIDVSGVDVLELRVVPAEWTAWGSDAVWLDPSVVAKE